MVLKNSASATPSEGRSWLTSQRKKLSANLTIFVLYRIGCVKLSVSMVIIIAASAFSVAIAQATPTVIKSDVASINKSQLPQSVNDAVLQQISQRTGMPPSSFRVVSAEPRTWSNGCFGLSDPNTFCTQALVPGWRVTVTDEQRCWIYRTDQTNQVKLEQ